MEEASVMVRLNGKIAIVTGGASGIGREVARRFAAEGAWVVAGDVAEFANSGDWRIDQHRLDVANESQWTDLVAHVLRSYGRIDVLVNAAGVISYDAAADLELAEWQRVIDVDQTGVFLGMKAVLPSMLERSNGSIINLSSAWGLVGGVGVTAYNAAKGAVRAMSLNAAVSYAEQGIRVNSMVPGWIRSPMTDRQPEEANRRVVGATPMGHGGEPTDIAAGCVYLASDEASFVTGVDFIIDGGLLAV